MKEFLLISLIASIVLTIALNLLPMIFPQAAAKAERKIAEKIQSMQEDTPNANAPKLRVFFPWKAMLMISIALTLAVNLLGLIAR